MEISTLFKKILTFGKESGYFHETTIGNLDKSCCPNSHLEVIDFLGAASTPVETQIAALLKTEVDKMAGSPFDNIQKPQLTDCKSLDGFYSR